MGALRAHLKTPAAANAFKKICLNFFFTLNRLGVMAPFAVKGTSFHKNSRPYAGTIIYGKMLNIKYKAIHL